MDPIIKGSAGPLAKIRQTKEVEQEKEADSGRSYRRSSSRSSSLRREQLLSEAPGQPGLRDGGPAQPGRGAREASRGHQPVSSAVGAAQGCAGGPGLARPGRGSAPASRAVALAGPREFREGGGERSMKPRTLRAAPLTLTCSPRRGEASATAPFPSGRRARTG